MADPSTILVILKAVGTAALALCQVIDKATELEHEARHALKDLRKGIDSINSDTLVYKVLMNAMENDTDLSGHSPYTRFIQRYVMETHMLTELIMYTITGRTEWEQWKVLKERSRLPFYCSRRIQWEIAIKLR